MSSDVSVFVDITDNNSGIYSYFFGSNSPTSLNVSCIFFDTLSPLLFTRFHAISADYDLV